MVDGALHSIMRPSLDKCMRIHAVFTCIMHQIIRADKNKRVLEYMVFRYMLTWFRGCGSELSGRGRVQGASGNRLSSQFMRC